MVLTRLPFALASLTLLPMCLHAQTTAAGLWETVDDQTKQPASHIRVLDVDGTLTGVIDRILDPAKSDARCTACEDSRHDKPLVGMAIFLDVKPQADEPLTWNGGEILDPKSGHTYKVRIRLISDGTALEVRGYKGSPMFGRTQIWQRVPEPASASVPASASGVAALP